MEKESKIFKGSESIEDKILGGNKYETKKKQPVNKVAVLPSLSSGYSST
jgi:hypothetical protein